MPRTRSGRRTCGGWPATGIPGTGSKQPGTSLLEFFTAPLPLLAGAESAGDPIAVVLPVLFHLLWCQDLTVDLSVPLHDGSRVRIAGDRR